MVCDGRGAVNEPKGEGKDGAITVPSTYGGLKNSTLNYSLKAGQRRLDFVFADQKVGYAVDASGAAVPGATVQVTVPEMIPFVACPLSSLDVEWIATHATMAITTNFRSMARSSTHFTSAAAEVSFRMTLPPFITNFTR